MNLPTRLALVTLLATGAAGCADNLLPVDGARPACVNPAPLLGKKSTAPGYIVSFHRGTDAASVTRRLADRYGFTPTHVYRYAIQGFAAELSGMALAGVRCEREVDFVEHDGVVSAGI